MCPGFYGENCFSSVVPPCRSVLAPHAVGGGIGRVGGVDRLAILVQDYQSTDHTWNPSGDGEDRDNQERTTTLVHYSQRRENN